MRIFSRGTLRDYWKEYPETEQALKTWFDIFNKYEFKNSNEVKKIFGSADVVKNGKVVFNICGNKHRLIVKFRYDKHIVFILFIGTHKEYDNIDVDKL